MPEPTHPPSAPLLSDRAADRDLLDLTPYTQTLLDIIRDPATEGPLVIGLFGTWGSGKTALMQFVRDELARDAARKFRLAWFDAWKYDKEDALWRALLLRVIDNRRDRDDQGVDITPEPLKSEIARLEQRLYRDVEWEEKGGLTVDLPKLGKAAAAGAIKLSFAMLPGFAAEVVKAAQAALGNAEDAGKFLDAFDRHVIEHHQAQLRSIEQFQHEFEKLVAERIVAQGERLVVFVDDLDRCLPEKAIEVLEAIKLFLDVKGCIFLLGLDQEVVTRGIKVKYREFAVDEGAEGDKRIPIDGAQYLEKIIQLPFRLPKIEPRAMQPFVAQLAAFPDPRCADVFAEGLETNPRKVKRGVNIFLFLSKLAERRKIPSKPVRLAKIVVVYHSHAELYDLLRLNPALLRDLEAYLRQQAASTPREGTVERTAQPTATAPVPARLITDALKRVLTLYLDDRDACFLDADYAELASYFTLTRGAVVETPAGAVPESAARGALPFPVLTFVSIPAGEFLMGTSDHQPPSHWSGGTFAEELSAHPVVNVSWNNAVAYCEWLTEKFRISDCGFNLPKSAIRNPKSLCVCRRRRNGRNRRAGQTGAFGPGAISGMPRNATRQRARSTQRRRWANIRPAATVRMALRIWQAMCGSGARIGTTRTITRTRPGKIQRVLLLEITASCAAARSTVGRGTCGARSAAGAALAAGAGFRVFGLCFLPFSDSGLWSLWALGLWRGLNSKFGRLKSRHRIAKSAYADWFLADAGRLRYG